MNRAETRVWASGVLHWIVKEDLTHSSKQITKFVQKRHGISTV